MAKGGFYDYLKQLISDMVDQNGNLRVQPIGLTAKRNLSNSKIKLLSDLIVLLRDTNIVSKESKYYINNKYITIAGVNELVNQENKDKEEIKFNNTLSKISYDRNKLEKLFGANFFIEILTKDTDIEQYEVIIAEQFIRYSNGKNKLKEKIAINIPNNCMYSEITDEEFENFVDMIKPYIRSQMEFIEENMSKEACGYFNYISNMPTLNSKDLERLNTLKDLLGI